MAGDNVIIGMEEIKAKSYTLTTANGDWLGQVVLTTDGMFSGVTDYGNMSYAWRHFGTDFREFILKLEVDYFGSKLSTGMAYIAYSRKVTKACERFAEEILPALQEALRQEIKNEA